MKRLLLFLALLLPLTAFGQPLLRNSLTTNDLSTNFVWNPAIADVAIRGATPSISFWNTSGGVDLKRFGFLNSGNQLRFEWTSDNGGSLLLLGTFSSDGNFAPVSLSLSGETNRLTIANDQLMLDGVAVASSAGTNVFNVMKGGHLTISNNITILTNGTFTFSNLPWPSVLLVGADGNATNATLSGLSLSGTTLTATGSASVWVPVTTLAFATTNVTIPLNGGTNFVVTLTNGATGYFTGSGAPAAATTNTTFTLTVVQDATGTRVMNWNTNIFQFQGGYVTPVTTNAAAEDVFTLTASAKTAGKFNVTWNPNFQ